jgi:hypothetical protein
VSSDSVGRASIRCVAGAGGDNFKHELERLASMLDVAGAVAAIARAVVAGALAVAIHNTVRLSAVAIAQVVPDRAVAGAVLGRPTVVAMPIAWAVGALPASAITATICGVAVTGAIQIADATVGRAVGGALALAVARQVVRADVAGALPGTLGDVADAVARTNGEILGALVVLGTLAVAPTVDLVVARAIHCVAVTVAPAMEVAADVVSYWAVKGTVGGWTVLISIAEAEKRIVLRTVSADWIDIAYTRKDIVTGALAGAVAGADIVTGALAGAVAHVANAVSGAPGLVAWALVVADTFAATVDGAVFRAEAVARATIWLAVPLAFKWTVSVALAVASAIRRIAGTIAVCTLAFISVAKAVDVVVAGAL